MYCQQICTTGIIKGSFQAENGTRQATEVYTKIVL